MTKGRTTPVRLPVMVPSAETSTAPTAVRLGQMPAPAPLRRNRDFVLLQTGQALSTVGSEAAAVAYTLLVLSVTHSPAKAGLVGFVRLAPWPLLALPAGVAVDRWNRKHLMIVADVARVVAVGAL